MERLKVATVWLGGCSGCHMSFLDLDEFLIDLAGKIDLVYSPVVDVKEYPENVDVCLIEGAVCNEDNLEMLHKIRARTKVLVSFGDCAVTGNVPPCATSLAPATRKVFCSAPMSRTRRTIRACPRPTASCPHCSNACMPVHEVVHVEYFLPGCPPPADRIKALLAQVLERRAHRNSKARNLKFG